MTAALERVEVWDDVIGATPAGVRLVVIADTIQLTDVVNLQGKDRLEVSIPRASAAWAHILEGRVIRPVYVDATFDEWRIRSTKQTRQNPSGNRALVRCEPIRFDLLREGVIERVDTDGRVSHDFGIIGQTIATFLADFILPAAPGYFAAGTIDPTKTIDMTFEWDSPLAACLEMAKLTDSRLAIRPNAAHTSWFIDFVVDVTPTLPTKEFRAKKNLLGITYERNADQQATRVFPRGGDVDGVRLTMAEAKWRVKTIAGLDITLEDPNNTADGPLAFNDQLNSAFLEKTDGTTTAITDSILSTQIVVVASAADIAVGELIRIRATAARKQLTFLDSPVDQTTFGLIPRVLDREDLPVVQNLVANAELTGTYVGNLPPNWNQVGGPSLAENTNALFSRRGKQSLQVSSLNDGDGVQTDLIAVEPTAERPFFSAYFTVWQIATNLSNGRVRVELVDETNNVIIPTGDEGRAFTSEVGVWVDLGVQTIDLFARGTKSVRLRVVVDGNTEGDFYVDSAQLSQTAAHQPFFAGDGPLELWKAANIELLTKGQPRVSVDINIVDLTRIDPKRWPYDAVGLNDPFRLVDEDLNVDLATPVVERQRDLLTNGLTRVKLSNRPEDMTDALLRPRRRSRLLPGGEVGFDDPRVADPAITAEGSTIEITYSFIFDPETARIEVFTIEDTIAGVARPPEEGPFQLGAPVLPIAGQIQATLKIATTTSSYRRSVFVAYHKNGTRGRTIDLTTQAVNAGGGPSTPPAVLNALTPTETTINLTWNPATSPFGQVWQVAAPSTFVDETTDANSAANADWQIFPTAEVATDYVTLGFAEQFPKVTFDNLNGTAGVGGVVVWEYWNGTTWVALTGVTDGTTGFTAAVANGQALTFTVPSDWAKQVLNGSANLYYIRARITTVYTTNPVYDQGFINVGDASAQTRIYRDGIVVFTAPAGATTHLDTGLIANTTYKYEVDHFKNGQASIKSDSDTEITTSPQLASPFMIDACGRAVEGVKVLWDNGDATAQTVVERSDDSGGSPTGNWAEIKTVPAGDVLLFHSNGTGFKHFRLFHRKTGWADSVVSTTNIAEYYVTETCLE